MEIGPQIDDKMNGNPIEAMLAIVTQRGVQRLKTDAVAILFSEIGITTETFGS